MRIIFPVAVAVLLFLFPTVTHAQGTAFTYQGQLRAAGVACTGTYDFRFTLYDAADTNGNALTSPLLVPSVVVTNGLFTAIVDFQTAGVFNGDPRWLAVELMPHGGASTFAMLQPLQPITAVPYAITSGNAITGGLGANAGFLNPTNLIPPGAVYDNGTSTFDMISGETAGYAVPVTPGELYYFVYSGNNSVDDDWIGVNPGSPGYGLFELSTGLVVATTNFIWIGGNQAGGLVGNALYYIGTNNTLASYNMAVSNLAVGSVTGGSFTRSTINNATINNATFNGPTFTSNGVINFQNFTMLNFGNVGSIYANPVHGPAGEMQIMGTSRMALLCGYDNNHTGALQIGTAGWSTNSQQGSACPVYINEDKFPLSTSLTNGGPLGYSLMFNFASPYYGLPGAFQQQQYGSNPTNVDSYESFIGARAEATDTNGACMLNFYDVHRWNPLIGQSPGTSLFQIRTNAIQVPTSIIMTPVSNIPFAATNLGVNGIGMWNSNGVLYISKSSNGTAITSTTVFAQ